MSDRPLASKDQPWPVRTATAADRPHAPAVVAEIDAEVKRGGLGLARRTREWVEQAMADGDGLIALAPDQSWAGFCCIHLWEGGRFVATSSLVIAHEHRGRGLAARLKAAAVALARSRYPAAVPFGLTTSAAVVAVNRRLGFREVPYAEITRDPGFWRGCESCPLHPTLLRNRGERCRCTAMRLDSDLKEPAPWTPG